MSALKRVKGVVTDVAHPILTAKRKVAESKTRGFDKQYNTYKMVNDADKAGVKDKGNSSDELFKGRAAMKEAQRKALERKI